LNLHSKARRHFFQLAFQRLDLQRVPLAPFGRLTRVLVRGVGESWVGG
jgi:hypothetical protein